MCQEAQWAVHFVTQHPLGLLLFPPHALSSVYYIYVLLGYFQIGASSLPHCLYLCVALGYFQIGSSSLTSLSSVHVFLWVIIG